MVDKGLIELRLVEELALQFELDSMGPHAFGEELAVEFEEVINLADFDLLPRREEQIPLQFLLSHLQHRLELFLWVFQEFEFVDFGDEFLNDFFFHFMAFLGRVELDIPHDVFELELRQILMFSFL